MNPKYAEDPTWSSKVNKYIEKNKICKLSIEKNSF